MLKNKIIAKKIRNIFILLMAIIIMIGAYHNIRRSRAENVIEISVEVADKNNRLEVQTITIEATETSDGVYMMKLPTSVNTNIVTKYYTVEDEEIDMNSTSNEDITLELTADEIKNKKVQLSTEYDTKEVVAKTEETIDADNKTTGTNEKIDTNVQKDDEKKTTVDTDTKNTEIEKTTKTELFYNKELTSEDGNVILTGYMPQNAGFEVKEIDISTLTAVKLPSDKQSIKNAFEISVFENVEVKDSTETVVNTTTETQKNDNTNSNTTVESTNTMTSNTTSENTNTIAEKIIIESDEKEIENNNVVDNNINENTTTNEISNNTVANTVTDTINNKTISSTKDTVKEEKSETEKKVEKVKYNPENYDETLTVKIKYKAENENVIFYKLDEDNKINLIDLAIEDNGEDTSFNFEIKEEKLKYIVAIENIEQNSDSEEDGGDAVTPVIPDTSEEVEATSDSAVLKVVPASDYETTAKYTFFGNTNVIRGEIENITFVNSISGANSTKWDISESGDGSILAWYEKNASTQAIKVYIGSNKKMYANPNSSYLFYCVGSSDSTPNKLTLSASEVITNINLLDVSNVTDMSYMFNQVGTDAMTILDLGDNFDTSKVTNMSAMFAGAGWDKMTTIKLGNKFNTSKVTNMSYMFDATGYYGLTSLDLGDNFDTSNVTDMTHMFFKTGHEKLTSLNLGNKFNTSKVTNMRSMFEGTGYKLMTSLDLGDNFDTSNVTNMAYMFFSTGYYSLKTLYLGTKFTNIPTGKVTLPTGEHDAYYNMLGSTGKSGSVVIYVPEEIYANKNALKTSSTSSTTFSFTRGTIKKIKPEWTKKAVTVGSTVKVTLTGTSPSATSLKSTLAADGIKVFIDGTEAKSIKKRLYTATTTTDSSTGELILTQVVELYGIQESTFQPGKSYKEWSGNIKLQIPAGTLTDSRGKTNDLTNISDSNASQNKSGTLFLDTIKPTIKYKYNTSDIDHEQRTISVTFDVMDKYMNSNSIISATSLGIKLDGKEPDWSKVTRSLSNTDLKETVNGDANHVVGKRYTLTLSGLEQSQIKSGDKYLDYSGILTVAIPAGITADLSGNTNEAQTITMGISLPENTGSAVIGDVVRPTITKELIETNLASGSATLTISATDKYYADTNNIETNGVDYINIYVNGSTTPVTGISTVIRKATPLTEERTVNGKTTTEKYGMKYEITINGIPSTADQVKATILEGAIIDKNGNKNAQIDFLIMNSLRATNGENLKDSPFLGNTALKRQNIFNVTFVNGTSQKKSNAWDVSAMGDGSILAWYEGTTSQRVYIGSDFDIYANSNANDLFAYIGYGRNCGATSVLDGMEYLHTSNVTSMREMFFYTGYRSMTELNLGSHFDTSNVVDMSRMFTGCGYNALSTITLGELFNTARVTDMSWMFAEFGYKALQSLDLGTQFYTSNVTNMSWMFADCGNVAMSNLNLRDNFDTTNVSDMSHMFQYCGYTNLSSISLGSKFNTSNVVSMEYMFSNFGYTKLTSLNLGEKFNTQNVLSMRNMFESTGYKALKTLKLGSNFYTSKVTEMEKMFMNCGATAMTTLDLGPAFTNIASSNSNFLNTCGKSGVTIYAPEAIYKNKNLLKLNTSSSTTISYTRGKINPIYRTEWIKDSVTFDETGEMIKIKIRGRVNSEATGYTSSVTSSLTTENITVYIDGEEATSISKSVTVAAQDSNEVTHIISLQNFEETARQSGKNFKEWSGNISLKIAAGTLTDSTYGNKNLSAVDTSGTMTDILIKDTTVDKNTDNTMFLDKILPEFTYIYSSTDINHSQKTLTVDFSVTDKYFNSSTVLNNVNNIIVKLLDTNVTIANDKITKNLTLKTLPSEITDGKITYKTNGDVYYNGKKVGQRYTLVIGGLEQATIASDGKYKDYSGPMSITLPSGIATDKSGNTNVAKTIVIGVNEPGGSSENKEIVDIVSPLWKVENINKDATNQKLTLDLVGTDKYFSSSSLTTNNIKIYVDGVDITAKLQKSLSAGTALKETRIVNGTSSTVQYGIKYTLTLSNWEESTYQSGKSYKEWSGTTQIEVEANTLTDNYGNKSNKQTINIGQVDLVKPEARGKLTSNDSKTKTAIFTINAVDKYWKESTLTKDNLQVLGDGVNITSGITKEVVASEQLTETRDGKTVQYGIKYTITIKDYPMNKNQVKIRIPEGVFKDTSGNVNKATDFMLYTALKTTNTETEQTSPFFGNTNIQRQNIENVTFETSTSGANSTAWDVSATGDRSILAWYETSNSNGALKVHIGSDASIFANENSSYLFSYVGYSDICTATQTITNLNLLTTGHVKNMNSMFCAVGFKSMTSFDLGENFDTSSVTSMREMFYLIGFEQMTTINIRNIDTSNVVDMQSMFNGCGQQKLTSLDLGVNFDTSNVVNMGAMFSGCGAAEMSSLNLGDKFSTSKVTNMTWMFNDCGFKIKEFRFKRNFDTSNVTTMIRMFRNFGAYALTDFYLGDNFKVDKVEDMYEMFAGTGQNTLKELDLGAAWTNLPNKYIGENSLSYKDPYGNDVSLTFPAHNTYEGFLQGTGASGIKVYVSEKLYYDSKHVKTNTGSATVECTNGTVHPIYRTEWIKENVIVDTTNKKVSITLRGRTNLDTDAKDYTSDVTSLLTANGIQVFIDGTEITDKLTKTLGAATTATNAKTGAQDVLQTIELSNFEEVLARVGKNYKEWSGNITLKIAPDTLQDIHGNMNMERIETSSGWLEYTISDTKTNKNTAGILFADLIKPSVIYKNSNSSIDRTEKTYTMVFSVTDKYYSSGSLSISDLTIKIDGKDITGTGIESALSGESVTNMVDGASKTVGKKYTLTLSKLEQLQTKDETGNYIAYSGVVTVEIPANKFTDLSGNKNIKSTITSGVSFIRTEGTDGTTSAGTYLPAGFTQVAGTNLSNGLTIEDESGNQYVWVEVPKTAEVYPTSGLGITSFTDEECTKIENDLHTYTSAYRSSTATDTWASEETQGLTETQYYDLKKKMLKSIYKNGGFYVGKYEAGIEGAPKTSGSASVEPTEIPVIKANVYPYNYVTVAQAQRLAQKFETGGFSTSLNFGVQWDLILKYLETKGATQNELKNNSTTWGNYYINLYNITNSNAKYNLYDGPSGVFSGYKSVPYKKTKDTYVLLTTGASDTFSKQGIYDLAGNVWECTLESSSNSTTPYVTRGGSFMDDLTNNIGPASYRSNGITSYFQHDMGFRVALYKTEPEVVDVVDPQIEMISTTANAVDKTAEVTFKITDKYYSSSTLTADKIQVLVNGSVVSSGITKTLSSPTTLTEQRTVDGATKSVQYGVQYTLSISGYATDANQVKVRIPAGVVTDKSGNKNKEKDLIVYNVLKSASTETAATSNFLGKAIQRQNIDNITFEKSIPTSVYNHTTKKITDTTRAWDVSAQGDQSIVAWYVDSETRSGIYKVHIANNNQVPGQTVITKNEIFANQNSSNLFAYIGYSNKSASTEAITNIGLLNVSDVTYMECMFRRTGYTAMTRLDLGDNFDTSKVTDMSYMFENTGATAMTALNLGDKFDTKNVKDMSFMFFETGFGAMTSLDLGNEFDTSNVVDMNAMFMSTGEWAMTRLNLGDKFDTSNVIDMRRMFLRTGYKAMTSLDLGDKFDTTKAATAIVDEDTRKNGMDAMFDMTGETAMTSLDLGPAFTQISEASNYNIFALTGKADTIVIQAPEAIFENNKTFKLSTDSTTQIAFENGTISPKYRTEWVKESTKVTNTEAEQKIEVTLRGRTNAEAGNDYISNLESTLAVGNIKLYIDGVDITDIVTKSLGSATTTANKTTGANDVLQTLTLTNFEEASRRTGKSYKEWSGNIKVEVAQGTLKDTTGPSFTAGPANNRVTKSITYGNKNMEFATNGTRANNNITTTAVDKNTDNSLFADFIKPEFTYVYADGDIDHVNKTLTVQFDVTDKYFASTKLSNLDGNQITVNIDDYDETALNNAIRKQLTKLKDITDTVDGKTNVKVGERYRLVISNLEQKGQDGLPDGYTYSGYLSLEFAAGMITDKSGNTSVGKTIYIGKNEPGGADTDKKVVDVVSPAWTLASNNLETGIIKLRVSDKYLVKADSVFNLTTDKITVKVGGVASTIIEKTLSGPVEITANEEYEYTLVISNITPLEKEYENFVPDPKDGIVLDADGGAKYRKENGGDISIIIAAEAVTDKYGNKTKEQEFHIGNVDGIGPEVYDIQKTKDVNANTATFIFNITDKNYDSTNFVEATKLTIWVDGIQVDSQVTKTLSKKELKTTIDGVKKVVGHQYTLVIGSLKETVAEFKESGRKYRNLSGTIQVKINTDAANDMKGNIISEDTATLSNFVDVVKPEITYKYAEANIDKNGKTFTMVLSAVDKYFSSSSLSINDLTIKIDGKDINGTTIEKKLEEIEEITDTVQYTKSGEFVRESKTIGKNYVLTLSNLEQLQTKDTSENYISYSGIVTVEVAAGKITDTSGNSNDTISITSGVDLPDGTGTGKIVDVVDPLVEMLDTTASASGTIATVKFKITDKYFSSSTLTADKISVIVDGTDVTSGITKKNFTKTNLTEARGSNPSYKIGEEYSITISGFAISASQVKVRIPAEVAVDESTNKNKQTDLIVYNVLKSASAENVATSGFLGSTTSTNDAKVKAIQRQNIDNVIFEDTIPNSVYDHKNKTIKDATHAWDVSAIGDKSIIAWYVDAETRNGIYKIHIANNNHVPGQATLENNAIYANRNASYLFSYIGYSDKSQNTEAITNLGLLNVKAVTNMKGMFKATGVAKMTSLDLGSGFDTRYVTDMSEMFYNTGYTAMTSLNLEDNFDTSLVTNMSDMFHNTGYTKMTSLDLKGKFYTEKVTNMSSMFWGAGHDAMKTLTLGSNFNTIHVTNMMCMFQETGYRALESLNLGSKFETPSVTDMMQMFLSTGYTAMTTLILGDKFNTVNVTDMGSMFYQTGYSKMTALDLGDQFNTNKVGNMDTMFSETGLNAMTTLDLGPQFTKIAESHTDMFKNCGATNLTIYAPEAVYASITEFKYEEKKNKEPNRIMTNSTYSTSEYNYLNGDIANTKIATITFKQGKRSDITADIKSEFDASEKQDKSIMGYYTDANNDGMYDLIFMSEESIYANINVSDLFNNLTGLTSIDFTNFKTDGVTNMNNMFYSCSRITSLDLSNFDTSNVTNMSQMFDGCSGLRSLNISNFGTSNVTNMSQMFNGCSGLRSLNISNFDTSNVTNMSQMFNGCSGLGSLNISNFDTSNVTDMSSIFSSCSALRSLDLSNFDTSNVTNMSSIFSSCSALRSLDLSNFDTSNVTNMSSMFSGCSGLTSLDLSNFDTSNVTDMSSMFSGCRGLMSLNISNFDTSNVTDIFYMFRQCKGLTSLDLSNFDTSNVTSMSSMFSECSGLTSLDLSSFNTSKVIGMEAMFSGCSGLTSLDLSSFNLSKARRMTYMFSRCSGLTTIYVSEYNSTTEKGWNAENVSYSSSMFASCSNLVGGNGTQYNSNYTDATYARIDTASTPGYLTKKN